MDKKASELLLESAEPFDTACLKVRQLEEDFERCLGYLHYLGIDPMDGSPDAEEIVGMRIQGLKNEVGELAHELNLSRKELYDLKQSLSELAEHMPTVIKKIKIGKCKHKLNPVGSPDHILYFKCDKCNHVQYDKESE